MCEKRNVVLGKRILTFQNGFVTVSLFRYQFSFDIGSYPIWLMMSKWSTLSYCSVGQCQTHTLQ